MSRTITIVCEVEQPEANWIWESHRDGKFIHGINVTAISTGDALEKYDLAIEEITALEDELAESNLKF